MIAEPAEKTKLLPINSARKGITRILDSAISFLNSARVIG